MGNTKHIADGVKELDNRVIMVSEETKERDMRLAAEAKAHSEQLAAAMAAQLEAQMSALLATQFAKLEQNFVGANAPQNTQEEQIVASKTDQIRDLIVKVKDDPVFALRNFFEGSTVIEGNTAKASDIADLATLEDD
jgi:ribosomal protein L16 Arg81 hydroxylase